MAFGKPHKDPFGSRVGKLIDNATVGTQPSVDWTQFSHICNVINSCEEGPKDAVRALKKRIARNRNYKEIRLALSLIDCCMRNCGPSFHSLVVRRDFVKDVLAKRLKPKYNPPSDVQTHILGLVQSWATTYQGRIDVSDVQELYMDMLRKGVIFPAPTLGSPGVKADPVEVSAPRTTPTAPTVKPAAPSCPHPRITITLGPEQLAKLHSELDLVHMNVTVMSAILLENIPGFENPDDLQLLQKLQVTCRAMQDRIGLLLQQMVDEDLTDLLLSANDELNRTFLRYERFQRSRTRFQRAEEKSANTSKVPGIDPSAPCATSDLINFTSPDPDPGLHFPVGAAQFSSLNRENGIAAVGDVSGDVANASPWDRALPYAPSPNATPPLQPECSQAQSNSAPEPIYANVVSRGSELSAVPIYSHLSGPPKTDYTSGHTAASQSEPPKTAAPQMIGLEFDPLANANYSSEPIYEDLDFVINKFRTWRGSEE